MSLYSLELQLLNLRFSVPFLFLFLLTQNPFYLAVLHHLSTVDRRYAVLSELIRITKPYGTVMIQARKSSVLCFSCEFVCVCVCLCGFMTRYFCTQIITLRHCVYCCRRCIDFQLNRHGRWSRTTKASAYSSHKTPWCPGGSASAFSTRPSKPSC